MLNTNITNTLNTQTSPRFQVAGKEFIYKLFDAFLQKTVIEDKAIDFSEQVVLNEDGSVKLTGSDQSFTALMCGKPFEQFNLKEKPQQLRGEPDDVYQKRLAKFERENHYKASVQEYKDYVSACNVYKAQAYAFLEKPLSEEPKKLHLLKEPKEISVPQKKSTETDEHFEERMAAYQRKVDAREEKLADVRGENQKREEQYEKAVKEYKEQQNELLEKNKNIFLIASHLHWLWSLGAKDVATGCGFYGEVARIKKSESSTDGVWNVSKTGDLKKNLLLIYAIFERFLSWPKRPAFNNVDEVKKSLADFVFKARKDSAAPIRNGLLHLCNPDKYINFYTFKEKVAYVGQHNNLLNDYREDYAIGYNDEDALFYSQKAISDGEFEGDYRANRTEERICHIYDKLHAPTAV